MNLLAKLPIETEEQAYAVLLSDCYTEEGTIYSSFKSPAVPANLIMALRRKKLVRFVSGSIAVGKCPRRGQYILYSEEEKAPDLTDRVTAYYQAAVKFPRLSANSQMEFIRAASQMEEGEIDNKILARLWEAVYVLVFQEPSRKMLAKEYGQMNTLLRLYSGRRSMEMITEYLVNLEEYSKVPMLGALLHKKDIIAANLTGLKKRVTSRSTHEDKEDTY